MVGTNIGAGQPARAARITWIATALATGVTGGIGVFGVLWPEGWVGFFSATPAIHLAAASYLGVAGVAFPFLGIGLTLGTAFQAAGRPLWALIGITSRVLVVVAGGWFVVHATAAGLIGLAVVTAAGSIAYGAIVAIAFRAGTWRSAGA
jgi:Na+-driven multidrug efflux pump